MEAARPPRLKSARCRAGSEPGVAGCTASAQSSGEGRLVGCTRNTRAPYRRRPDRPRVGQPIQRLRLVASSRAGVASCSGGVLRRSFTSRGAVVWYRPRSSTGMRIEDRWYLNAAAYPYHYLLSLRCNMHPVADEAYHGYRSRHHCLQKILSRPRIQSVTSQQQERNLNSSMTYSLGSKKQRNEGEDAPTR